MRLISVKLLVRSITSAGKGDMIVWASKDGQFGFAKATFGKDKSITIKLDYNEQNMPKEADLDIVPPASNTTLPAVTKAQRDENTRRLTYEDSIRHAYIVKVGNKTIKLVF